MKVSVLMPSYNHEHYIGQAIESFLSQQTNFSIELLIGDDNSKDNTAQIANIYAQRYPDKIRTWKYEKNEGLLNNYKFLIENSKGKYCAILESDDYWTDPLKLQKQIDYMETHPNCGLTYTGVSFIDDQSIPIHYEQRYINGNIYEQLIESNHIIAATICFRKSLFDRYCKIDDYIKLKFMTFDYPMILSIAANNSIYGIECNTAVYRHLNNSISNSKQWEKIELFNINMAKIVDHITTIYGVGYLTKDMINNFNYYRLMEWSLKYDQIKSVKKYAKNIKAIDLKSTVLRYFTEIWIIKNRKFRGSRFNY